MADANNAREADYWNSAATRPWAEQFEPIDRLFAPVTKFALDQAAAATGEHVLDIGCGSGTTVLALAERVGTSGSVTGADISQQSVATAGARIADAGLRQAKVILCDVTTHAFAPESFDLAFSRFGVMFFADPVATFATLRRAMKPGGRMAFAVFRTARENRWSADPYGAVRHLLPTLPPPDPDAPGQFSWADTTRVRRILEQAGYRDVTLTAYDPELQYAPRGGAAEAAEFAIRIGPVARAIASGATLDRDAVYAGLHAFFERQDGSRGIVLPAALWIVCARV